MCKYTYVDTRRYVYYVSPLLCLYFDFLILPFQIRKGLSTHIRPIHIELWSIDGRLAVDYVWTHVRKNRIQLEPSLKNNENFCWARKRYHESVRCTRHTTSHGKDLPYCFDSIVLSTVTLGSRVPSISNCCPLVTLGWGWRRSNPSTWAHRPMWYFSVNSGTGGRLRILPSSLSLGKVKG